MLTSYTWTCGIRNWDNPCWKPNGNMLVILLSKFNRFYLFTYSSYDYYHQVNVPAVCYAREAGDNDSNNILMNDDETDHPHTSHLSCLHGQKYYQHGAQWTSLVDECFMCNCHYGRVICDIIICPVVQCPVPSAKPGMCCPTCEGKYKIPESLKLRRCQRKHF